MPGPGYVIAVLKVSDRDSDYLADRIQRGTINSTAGSSQGEKLGRKAATALANLVTRLASGIATGNLWMAVLDSTAALAAGNIACVRANAAGDYVRFTYGAKTITLTEGTDFLRGASDTTCAANLAAAINAHPVLGNILTATGNVGDCELDAKIPTSLTHDIAITTDDATAFTLTQLASGTEGAAEFFLQHFRLNKDT